MQFETLGHMNREESMKPSACGKNMLTQGIFVVVGSRLLSFDTFQQFHAKSVLRCSRASGSPIATIDWKAQPSKMAQKPSNAQLAAAHKANRMTSSFCHGELCQHADSVYAHYTRITRFQPISNKIDKKKLLACALCSSTSRQDLHICSLWCSWNVIFSPHRGEMHLQFVRKYNGNLEQVRGQIIFGTATTHSVIDIINHAIVPQTVANAITCI